MKHLLLHRVITFGFISGSFLAITPSADAELLVVPVLYQHDGLTFAEPLTYDQPVSRTKASLSFTQQEKVELLQNLKPSEKPSLIVSPTIGHGQGTTVFQAALPTPKLYLEMNTQSQEKKIATPTKTAQPTKTASPVATAKPTQPPVIPVAAAAELAPTSGGMADQLFSMANNYRQSRGLAPLQKDDRTCSLAASRAPEVAGEVASGALHSGLQARALPYWNTENIISMNSAEAAFNWWINDPIHHDAIVGNYTYSCVACSGGNCAQEFTNYQPK